MFIQEFGVAKGACNGDCPSGEAGGVLKIFKGADGDEAAQRWIDTQAASGDAQTYRILVRDVSVDPDGCACGTCT